MQIQFNGPKASRDRTPDRADSQAKRYDNYRALADQERGVVPLSREEFDKLVEHIDQTAGMSQGELAAEVIRIVKERTHDWAASRFRL